MWGKPAEIQGLDPISPGDASSLQILDLAYDTLVGVDGDLNFTPRLATSWKQTSPTTWVFDIRKGVKFSNGRKMTADDVVGSLERLLDPENASYWAGQLGDVKSVTKDGPWKVKITLREPRASLVAALAYGMTAILPMKELESGQFDPKKEVVGTGAFKVDSHNQDESWQLSRNPDYWREGEPKAEKVTVRIMPEDAARVAALRDGSIDVATFDTPDAVQLLKGQPNIATKVQDTTDYYNAMINANKGIFSDPHLREALALSIDRDKISELALVGTGRPSAAVGPGFREACDLSTLPSSQLDLDRARDLVDAAGAKGKPVTIVATPAYKTFPQIAQVIQENLEQIGLRPRILQVDQAEWVKRLGDDSGDFDISMNYFGGFGDPAMSLVYYTPTPGFNKSWVKPDPELARLVQSSLEGTEDRANVLAETCDRIARDANVIPLVTRASIVGYRSDKLSAPIPKLEGYSLPLRRITEFSVK